MGCARSLHQMSVDGQFPRFFQRTNKHGVPANAMVFNVVFSLLVILLGGAVRSTRSRTSATRLAHPRPDRLLPAAPVPAAGGAPRAPAGVHEVGGAGARVLSCSSSGPTAGSPTPDIGDTEIYYFLGWPTAAMYLPLYLYRTRVEDKKYADGATPWRRAAPSRESLRGGVSGVAARPREERAIAPGGDRRGRAPGRARGRAGLRLRHRPRPRHEPRLPAPGLLPTKAGVGDAAHAAWTRPSRRCSGAGCAARAACSARARRRSGSARRPSGSGARRSSWARTRRAARSSSDFMWSQEPQRVRKRAEVPVYLVDRRWLSRPTSRSSWAGTRPVRPAARRTSWPPWPRRRRSAPTPPAQAALVEDGPPVRARSTSCARGSMELDHGDQVVDVLEPGEAFGHPSLLTGLAPAFTVRAHEPSVCLVLPRGGAAGARASGGDELRGADAARADGAHRAPRARLPELSTTTLGALLTPSPAVRGRRRDGRRGRAAHDRGAGRRAALVDDRRQGWAWSTTPTCARVCSPPAAAAGRAVCAPPCAARCWRCRRTGWRARRSSRMFDAGAREVCVRRRRRTAGRPRHRGGPRAVRARSVRAAPRARAARPTSTRWRRPPAPGCPRMLVALVDAGLDAGAVARVLTAQSDAATARLIDFAIERHGPAPVPWAWLALGSVARRELTLASDQDNAFAYAAGGGPEADAYFAAVTADVNAGLAACGFGPDHAGVLARDPRWRMTDERWAAVLRECLEHPDRSGLVRAAVSFDFRHVAGGLPVIAPLVAIIREAPAHPDFLRRLARTVTDLPVPVPRRSPFRRAAPVIDLKRGAILPIANLARLHALSRRRDDLADPRPAGRRRAAGRARRHHGGGAARGVPDRLAACGCAITPTPSARAPRPTTPIEPGSCRRSPAPSSTARCARSPRPSARWRRTCRSSVERRRRGVEPDELDRQLERQQVLARRARARRRARSGRGAGAACSGGCTARARSRRSSAAGRGTPPACRAARCGAGGRARQRLDRDPVAVARRLVESQAARYL